MSQDRTRLYIPRRTQLQNLWRTVDEQGRLHWHVYTACADPNATWENMQGTAFQLGPDGSITRYTDDNGYLSMMEVMPQLEGHKS